MFAPKQPTPNFTSMAQCPFTIVARYGEVTFQRQRLFHPTKKKIRTRSRELNIPEAEQ
ncbi:MAG: hypothetical protein FWH27_05400 [Planctomycetaceae bacterium]|nr:hypothetical protein [Planctomycetaceae bacterium]